VGKTLRIRQQFFYGVHVLCERGDDRDASNRQRFWCRGLITASGTSREHDQSHGKEATIHDVAQFL